MLALSSALLCTSPAQADAPSFDRPGISFSTSVLPTGSFDWEQGLPDLQRDHVDGVWSTALSASTTLRFGLRPTLELQLSGTPWNRLDQHDAQTSQRVAGAGDARVSLKWAPPLAANHWSLAVLGGVTFATGKADFSNGQSVYSLGVTLARDLGGQRSFAGYANVDRSGGTDTWTVSSNFGFPIGENFAGYVEAGRVFGGGESSILAGAGVTWLLRDRVQLDLYGRRGLTARSPDLQAGAGVSVFWP